MKKDKIVDKIEKKSEKLLKKCNYDHEAFCREIIKESAEVEKIKKQLLAKNKRPHGKRAA